MIRFIAAIDNKRGLADDHGIPWQGKLPTDVRYYHEKISGAVALMGYGMYKELSRPLVNKTNHVASRRNTKLKEGFILIQDAEVFLKSVKTDVWVLGGAALFTSTLHLADELYITQIYADFNCTKFFPAYESGYHLVKNSNPMVENALSFQFQIWARNKI
jgi:dihydrofolate reductase